MEPFGIMIGVEQIREAADRLAPWVHRTPVVTSRTIDAATGATVVFKCENLQRVGAFKFRGAMNALLMLDSSKRAAGVVTHSSGNHAQALARAGQLQGVPVWIVMPRTAPAVKRAATEGYGARIVLCEPTLESREETVAGLVEQHGFEVIHPFNDWRVIAGQGTAALELLEQAGSLDLVAVPCGGGGLLSGTALAVKGVEPRTRVAGVEPAAADDARRSLIERRIVPSGDPRTIADGLRTSLGDRTFAVIRQYVDEIVAVDEAAILRAMRMVFERMKLVIEPSAAVPVAAVLEGALAVRGCRVGVILSGGNVDLEPLFTALEAQT